MNDKQVAMAQIGIAYMYGLGFLAVVVMLIVRPPTLDEFAKGVLLTLFGYLGALVQQQSSYFFARQRPDAAGPTQSREERKQ